MIVASADAARRVFSIVILVSENVKGSTMVTWIPVL